MSDTASLSFLCFSFALLYTVFELVRLFCPVWAMKFSGRYTRQADILALHRAEVTNAALSRSVSIESTINRLVLGTTEPKDTDFVRHFRLSFIVLLGCIALSLWLGTTEQPREVIELSYDLIPLAVGMIVCQIANYRCARVANLIDAHFGQAT